MDEKQTKDLIRRLADGQEIEVVTESGDTFSGFYHLQKTSNEMIAFETEGGSLLKARWANLSAVNARSPTGPRVYRPNDNLAHWNQPGYVPRPLKGES